MINYELEFTLFKTKSNRLFSYIKIQISNLRIEIGDEPGISFLN